MRMFLVIGSLLMVGQAKAFSPAVGMPVAQSNPALVALDDRVNVYGRVCDSNLLKPLEMQSQIMMVRGAEEARKLVSIADKLKRQIPICDKCNLLRNSKNLWREVRDLDGLILECKGFEAQKCPAPKAVSLACKPGEFPSPPQRDLNGCMLPPACVKPGCQIRPYPTPPIGLLVSIGNQKPPVCAFGGKIAAGPMEVDANLCPKAPKYYCINDRPGIPVAPPPVTAPPAPPVSPSSGASIRVPPPPITANPPPPVSPSSTVKGLYVGYMNGNVFITTQNITELEAYANCKLNAANNPNTSIKCLWNGKVILSR